MTAQLVARLVILLLVPTVAFAGASLSPPSGAWLLDQVKILSAPEMEGRAAGTPGAHRAAQHIARFFRQVGLQPCCGSNGYLQPLEVVTGTRLGTPNRLALEAARRRDFVLGQDFMPFAVSSDGTTEANLVFVGYGITASPLGYDDYDGLDVRGKIVLAMSDDPGAADPASPFRGSEAFHYGQRSHKIINARRHGAHAILLVTRPGSPERLPLLRGISQPWGIQALFITRDVADVLLAPSGAGLTSLRDRIDHLTRPHSFPVPGVRVKIDVTLTRERGSTTNVVGLLPGTDPELRDESLVIGAHYDHLGRGGEGSLAPDQIGTIHYGADDNASGTAAVMALARAFAARGGLSRTLVFAAFAGEELGMLGSSEYVKRPATPLENTVLMVNLDMVGRLRERRLYVFGAESGTDLRTVVTRAAQGLPLTLRLRGDPLAPSDHTPFYLRERPVLLLSTGIHGAYHRPGDTWEKINAEGMETILTFAARLIERVGSANSPPVYVELARPPLRRSAGYGPFFGVVPDFGESDRPGVKLGGVRPGSPADRAGVKAGDIIVRFADLEVHTLYDLTFALRAARPGDRVQVILLRDGREVLAEATLEPRR